MKYMLLIASISALILLSSCGDPIFARMGCTLDNQEIDMRPSSVMDAWKWISENIEYHRDPSGGLKRLPEETYALRYGDCEDYALLLAYFANLLDDPVYVVIGEYKGSGHAVCRYHGELIEPQSYGKKIPESKFDTWEEFTYIEALYSYKIRSTK